MKPKATAYALLLSILLLIGCDSLYAAALDASLDRIRLPAGETVTLTLTSEGDLQGSPDLSPLTHDFEVLEQGQSTRVSIINGHSSSTKQWQILLVPRRAGALTIPPLRIKDTESQPITLVVLSPEQALKDDPAQPFFLEVEAEPQDPYVQSAVHYTVRVFSRAPLQQASLTEPHGADAIVEQVGEDRSYSAYRSGVRYDVTERRYAVFPQRSGQMVITGPTLSASVPEPAAHRQNLAERLLGRDPFSGFPNLHGLFEETRPVRAHARDVPLEVKPQPPGTALPWLPAKSLELSESWSPQSAEFHVGQPITRTITVTARGLTGAQLPEINPPDVYGLKIYPDKSTAENRTQGDDLIATKTIRTALMPTRAGRLTLPETDVQWWDITGDKPRTARLPARIIEVMPGAAGTAPLSAKATTRPTASSRGEQPTRPEAATAPRTEVHDPSREPPAASPPAAHWWPWLAGALGLAWLATLGLWLWTRKGARQFGKARPPEQAKAESDRQALKRVQRAFESKDPRAARAALLKWARARWPANPPPRLEALAARLGDPASVVLGHLDRHLYAGSDEPWDGESAWRELSPLCAPPAARAKLGEPPLPTLFP